MAIEARVNAEDVAGGKFFPSPGVIESLVAPEGTNIRWDAGYVSGDEVSPNYDSLIGKLIVHGNTRDEAINGLFSALAQLKIVGPATTIPAAMAIIDHPDFRSGNFSTLWLEKSVVLPESGEEYVQASRQEVEVGGRIFYIPFIDENAVPGGLVAPSASEGQGATGGSKARKATSKAKGAASDGKIKAPMQGTIVKVNVQAGDIVKAGTVLFVLEAMKMENPLQAPFDGVVESISIEIGSAISAGTIVAQMKIGD